MRTILTAMMSVIALGCAATANAAPVAGTATLAGPASAAKIVGDGGVWRCEGTTCTGQADARTSLAVAACSAVADGAGRVVAFAVAETAFDEAALKRCNRHLRAQ